VDLNDFSPDIRRLIHEALVKKVRDELGTDDPLVLERLAAAQSAQFFREGKFEAALDSAEMALQGLEGKQTTEARFLRGQVLNNLAEAQRHLGNREASLKNYDLAWRELQHSDDDRAKSAVLSNRGILLLGFGRTAEAIVSQKLALQFDEKAGDARRAFPNPFHCRFLGHKLSLASGTAQQSDYWQSAASHFAFASRVTSSGAAGDPASPPEVTRHSSVPCRPQSPCFWWVNENAFASL
jgi:tetratricopeptide (TPR) repeat protein